MRSILAPPVILALGLVLGNAVPAEGRRDLERDSDYDLDLDRGRGRDRDRDRGRGRLDWPWPDEECYVSERWCRRVARYYNRYCWDYEYGFCSTLFWIYDEYCWDYGLGRLGEDNFRTYADESDPDPDFRGDGDDLDLDRLREVDPGDGGGFSEDRDRDTVLDKREEFRSRRDDDWCEFPNRWCRRIRRYRRLFCGDFYHRGMCKLFRHFEREYCWW